MSTADEDTRNAEKELKVELILQTVSDLLVTGVTHFQPIDKDNVCMTEAARFRRNKNTILCLCLNARCGERDAIAWVFGHSCVLMKPGDETASALV